MTKLVWRAESRKTTHLQLLRVVDLVVDLIVGFNIQCREACLLLHQLRIVVLIFAATDHRREREDIKSGALVVTQTRDNGRKPVSSVPCVVAK